MHDKPLSRWRSSAVFAALGLLALAGCGSLTPGSLPAGTPIAEARQTNGTPTGEYDLKGGGHRLEYARGGAYGKQTYMLDFDAQGRLVKTEQVLTDANFAEIHRGMTGDEVRMRLGRPAWTDTVARPVRAQVWNYRYFEGDCLLFQVSINDAGHVVEAAHGPDLACDAPNDGHGISR